MGDEPPIPPRQHTPEAHLPGPFERHPFTPEQARHVALMRVIAQELTSPAALVTPSSSRAAPLYFCPIYSQFLRLMRYNFGESST